jgi:hypothetical protein
MLNEINRVRNTNVVLSFSYVKSPSTKKNYMDINVELFVGTDQS